MMSERNQRVSSSNRRLPDELDRSSAGRRSRLALGRLFFGQQPLGAAFGGFLGRRR